jgi:ribonuclease BN (tRNA processing enzyme)
MTKALGFSRRGLLGGLADPAIADRSNGNNPPVCVEEQSERVARQLREGKGTKLVVLGTGAGPGPAGPERKRVRRMTSHVILSNDAAYVVDCGLGVTNQFGRTGIAFNKIRSIFITHHHPDHNIEYGPLLVLGWISGMPLSVRSFGPPPLKEMTADFLRFAKTTIAFWAEDFKMKPLEAVEVEEVSTAGPVTEDGNVKVTAAIVEHPPVKPALAYRFDFHDRSIVFSGDTAPLEVVAQLANGADVLVHEAMYVPAVEQFVRDRIEKGFPAKFEPFMAHMKADHSPVESVGRIAQKAGVKTLVLSHLTPALETISDDMWREPAAKFFKGEIIVAHDLTVV